MNAILAMALKDLRLLTRDRVGLFFVFAFPFIYALFIGSIFSFRGGSGGGTINVAVVDQDATDASRDFAARLDKNPSVKLTTLPLDEAKGQVRRGRAVAYLVIPAGFGAARANPFNAEPPVIQLGTDPGHAADAAMLEGVLMQLTFEYMTDQFGTPDSRAKIGKQGLDATVSAAGSPEIARDRTQRFIAALAELDQLTRRPGSERSGIGAVLRPLTIQKESIAAERKDGPRNAFEYSFPQGISWAFLFCVTRFAASLVGERVRGTLVRMQVAPLSRWHIIGGKALACIISMTVVAGALTVFAVSVLNVEIRSYPLFLSGGACAILCFTGIMVLISTLGKTEDAAAGVGSAIMLVMTMTGGGAVPLLAMPHWMQLVSSVSPVKWAILALEGAIWRNFTPDEMILPCAILLGVGAACFTLGTRLFRWHAA